MEYDITRAVRDLHVTLDLSHYKAVFIATDIHDEWDELQLVLDSAGFDPTCHALVIAGDLVDRGPNPHVFLEWLKKPWVYRTLGNHDVIPGMYLDRQASEDFMNKVGAQWFLGLSRNQQKEIARILMDAPVAMTVITPGGKRIGISHADCLNDWDRQVGSLMLGNSNRIWVSNLVLWCRDTIDAIRDKVEAKEPVDAELYRVANIDHVFHGHTILKNHATVANRTWFDTGMCAGGKFTVIDVDRFLEGS